jgi:hypothetical protein
VQEHAAIKRLMFGPDDGETHVGIEIFARHIGEAKRHIGQFRKPLHLVGISNEAGWIDDNLAAVQPGVQNFAEGLVRARLPPFGRQHADADRTVELAEQVNAKRPGIGQIVVLIGDALGSGGLDRPLAQVGPVPQVVDLLFFLGRLRQTIIDLIQQVRTPSQSRTRWFGCGPHMILLINSNQLMRV